MGPQAAITTARLTQPKIVVKTTSYDSRSYDSDVRPRYGRRNQAETAMARYKHLIGPKLRARSLTAQKGEVAIAVAVLNTMIRTARPVSVRVA